MFALPPQFVFQSLLVCMRGENTNHYQVSPRVLLLSEQTLLQPLFCHRVPPGGVPDPSPPQPQHHTGTPHWKPPPGGDAAGMLSLAVGLSQAHVKEFVFLGGNELRLKFPNPSTAGWGGVG